MSKNIQIDERTHLRLKKYATNNGHFIQRVAAELINLALDIKAKQKPKP
jgi:hypothetical protein